MVGTRLLGGLDFQDAIRSGLYFTIQHAGVFMGLSKQQRKNFCVCWLSETHTSNDLQKRKRNGELPKWMTYVPFSPYYDHQQWLLFELEED